MATHRSAEKRNRQRITRTTRNKSRLASLRTALKKAAAAIATTAGDAGALTAAASKLLDRVASKGAIPKKRASRLKSRLAKRANVVAAPAATKAPAAKKAPAAAAKKKAAPAAASAKPAAAAKPKAAKPKA